MNIMMTKQKSPFLEKVRSVIRLKHYSFRTEQTYVAWIKRYIYFHKCRHPSEMRAAEVIQFLTDLAVSRQGRSEHPESSVECFGVLI